MSNKHSIKKNVLFNTAYQLLILLAPLVTTPYISRTIGADGVGIYSFTNSIVMYFTMFAALGTVGYGTREIARNRDDKKQISKLFFEIELLTVFTTAICLILWFIFILITNTYKVYYLILSFTLLATLFDISWFYAGIEEFKYTVTQNAIFKIIGIIALFVFVKDKDDTPIYVLIMALTILLGNMSMWVYLPRFVTRVPYKSLHVFRHFKETLIYFIPTIAISIYTVLDKTLIGIITHSEFENGYYEQATKIVNMLKSLSFYSINIVMGARISYLFVEKRTDEIKNNIHKSLDIILLVGYGVVFGLAGIARNFVPLFFGQGYEEVITLLYWMCPLVIIVGISNCLGHQYYTPVGLRVQSAKYIIAGSIVNLIMNLCLIPALGAVGAVIGSIVAEGTISVLYLLNCNKYLEFKDLMKLSFKRMLCGIIMFVFVYLLGDLPNNSNILKLLIQIMAGSFLYGFLLIMLKDNLTLMIITRVKQKLRIKQ